MPGFNKESPYNLKKSPAEGDEETRRQYSFHALRGMQKRTLRVHCERGAWNQFYLPSLYGLAIGGRWVNEDDVQGPGAIGGACPDDNGLPAIKGKGGNGFLCWGEQRTVDAVATIVTV